LANWRASCQLDEVADVMDWKLDAPALAQIDRIVTASVRDPAGLEFVAPPARLAA
jgi:hypothetical protein